MFPLNPHTFNLAAVLVLKVANILKVTFTGPSPMYVVVHGTSIQACLEKKYYLRELKFSQCNYFDYKEFLRKENINNINRKW